MELTSSPTSSLARLNYVLDFLQSLMHLHLIDLDVLASDFNATVPSKLLYKYDVFCLVVQPSEHRGSEVVSLHSDAVLLEESADLFDPFHCRLLRRSRSEHDVRVTLSGKSLILLHGLDHIL